MSTSSAEKRTLRSLEPWQFLIAAQLVLGGLFSLVRLLEPVITQQFARAGADEMLISMLPSIFNRYSILIAATTVGMCAITYRLRQSNHLAQLRLFTLISLTLFAYILLLTRSLQFPVSIDDSYIDYRYVNHVLSGVGLAFNPGDRVIGFTSNLHLWILVCLGWLFKGVSIPFLSQTLNIVVELATYCIGFITFQQIFKSQYLGLLFSITMAIYPPLIAQNILGKEGSIVILLLVLGMLAVELRRPKLLAWVGVLAFLARPEGVACMFISALYSVRISNLREALKAWALPMLIPIAWYLFLLIGFGTILPQGGLAKSITYYPEAFGQSLVHVMLHFALPMNCMDMQLFHMCPLFF